jgi:hypothetical protein
MPNPKISCIVCGKCRDPMLHMRADFPPDAARKWLRRYCAYAGKPCNFTYRPGFEIVGRAGAMSEPEKG